MLNRFMRILKKIVLWLLFLTILLVGGFMLFARFHPINLTPAATKILSWTAPETQFTFDELWFTHDGKFTLQAKNVVFEGIDNDNIGAIKTLSLRLANRSLALLNPSPKHIVINGIYYEGELRPKEQKSNQHQAALSQIEVLLGRLKWLKTITIEDVNIILTDAKTSTRWALKNGAGKGTYYKNEGLNLNIEGQLAQNDEKLAPAIVQLRTHPETHASTLNLSLSRLNMGWFKAYIPDGMRELFSGQINITVGTEWQPKKGWQPIVLSTRLTDLGLNLPVAFADQKQFDTVDIQGQYDMGKDRFLLNTFNIKKDETRLALKGFLENLTSQQPTIAASGTIFAKHTQDIWPLLPDQKMKNTLPFLSENVSATLAAPAHVSLSGPLHQIFRCAVDAPCTQLKITAPIASGSWVKPLEKAPRIVTSEAARMIWEGGALAFAIPTAKMGGQNLSDVSARIENIQTPPENPRALIVHGNMAGELEPALKIVKPMFNVRSAQMLTGLHATNIALELPIVRGVSPTIQTASLTVVTKTGRAALVGGIKGTSTIFTDSAFKLQANRLVGQGKVHYAKEKANYNVDYHLKKKSLSAKLDGKIDVSSLPVKLPEALKLNGGTPARITIQQTSQNAPLVFDVQADFTKTNVEVTSLNWQHQTGENLHLKAQGTWDNKSKALNTELFSLMGKGIEVAGQFYYPTAKPITAMTVQVSPIVLGNNRFNIEYLDNNLRVSGSSVDLSRLLNQKDKKQKIEWPKTLTADIDVQRVWFKNGFLQGIDINLTRRNNQWQRASLNGQMANLVPFNLRYEPHAEGYEMNVRTEDLGMLLSTTGISQKVRGGQLLGRLSLDKEHNGSGMVTLNNARFIKAPVLVQLVSLLSLEELVSGGTGIDFTEGAFPITKTGGSYRMKKAYLTGPSMALKFHGEVIPNDQYINLKGEFIPTAGINRAINSIPILGDILTGSQDGLIVAEFQSKGKWQKPETTVNPLATVTPGIVKDFFRILTGKDKE